MTSTVSQSFAGFGLPATQNTAPVFEFRCLWTTDLTRKQKRWNDGFLNYHTFNKRVVIHDDQHNTVLESHWRGADEPMDGDETTLSEKIIVQVEDRLGTKHTDLSQVVQRKMPRDAGNQGHSSPAASPRAIRRPLAPSQQKHKSLNALLGPRSGPIGKASAPQISPFQEREQAAIEFQGTDRASKRQKVTNHSPYNVVRVSRPAKSKPDKTPSLRVGPQNNYPRNLKTTRRENPGPRQGRLKVKEIIDITSDTPSSTEVTDPGHSVPVSHPTGPQPSLESTNRPRPRFLPASSPPPGTVKRISREPLSAENANESSPQSPLPKAPPAPKKSLRIGSTTRTKLLSSSKTKPSELLHESRRIDDKDGHRAGSSCKQPAESGTCRRRPTQPENDAEARRIRNEGLWQPDVPLETDEVEGAATDDARAASFGSHASSPRRERPADSTSAPSPPDPDRNDPSDVPVKPSVAGASSRSIRRSRSDLGPSPVKQPSESHQTAGLHRSISDTGASDVISSDFISSGPPDSDLQNPEVLGPWTDEAYDLLDWRPPWLNEESNG